MAGLFLGAPEAGEQPYRLDPGALRTHGVIVGMTGSGKTGLALVLLEELINAGVPIIAIDPKGDLGNLGLLFPALAESSFKTWAPDEDPAALRTRWSEGLSKWGLSPADVTALRDKIEFTAYTPGSDSGVAVDVLGALRPPAQGVDEETRAEMIQTTVSGLLGLTGAAADPVGDPAHVVLSQVLAWAWARGETPTLETLILKLVDPPFEKVGVFPVDAFFPPDKRMKLAMALNGLVASPTFARWRHGAPLDPDVLLKPGKRTRVSVFSIAHLGENERTFFLSVLLGQLQGWSRRQPGTDGLRACLFFDEVAGYLPPAPANPPTKAPLLTMMKQARAVGFGVIVATQNPVDMDYKALSNAGLWCIGRLNTQQDRDRLLKGIDAADLHSQVANLEKRQFVIHRVGRAEPTVIRSRHAMSFLRGPMTRIELGQLNGEHGHDAAAAQSRRGETTGGAD